MVCGGAGGGEEVLQQLVGQRRSEEQGELWTKVRLDWVRNWNQSSQTAVLLSRLEHTGRPHLSSPCCCGSAALEDFLPFKGVFSLHFYFVRVELL